MQGQAIGMWASIFCLRLQWLRFKYEQNELMRCNCSLTIKLANKQYTISSEPCAGIVCWWLLQEHSTWLCWYCLLVAVARA